MSSCYHVSVHGSYLASLFRCTSKWIKECTVGVHPHGAPVMYPGTLFTRGALYFKYLSLFVSSYAINLLHMSKYFVRVRR